MKRDTTKTPADVPELVITDGAPDLEKALARLWPEVLVQRCTVHKHRNLLQLHEEISADYKDMMYAAMKQEVEAKRKAFIRKWRLKCRQLGRGRRQALHLTRFPQSQWKSLRTSNAIERLHEEFKRPNQDSDRPAIGRNSRDVVLGSAGFGADHDAQSRWLAKPQRKAIRSGA
jgi:putative transposase